MHTKLARLMADNRALRSPARRFEVKAAANEATVYVYDTIVDTPAEAEYWGGVDAETFVRAVADLTAPLIHVRINSPGGSVFAARTMETALRQTRAKVITHVDGFAASAASYLALAGDEVEISDGAFFMIHKAWAFAMGNADDLVSTAALLEQIDASLADTYAKRTGLEREQIAAMMAAETWIGAQDAVQMGFAHRVAPDAKDTSAQALAWNLAAVGQPAPAQEPRVADDRTHAALVLRARRYAHPIAA